MGPALLHNIPGKYRRLSRSRVLQASDMRRPRLLNRSASPCVALVRREDVCPVRGLGLRFSESGSLKFCSPSFLFFYASLALYLTLIFHERERSVSRTPSLTELCLTCVISRPPIVFVNVLSYVQHFNDVAHVFSRHFWATQQLRYVFFPDFPVYRILLICRWTMRRSHLQDHHGQKSGLR